MPAQVARQVGPSGITILSRPEVRKLRGMFSMQRWLPGYVRAIAALSWVAVATLCTSTAASAETAWDPFASESTLESTSTLGAQIAPQDFDLPASPFSMIGSMIGEKAKVATEACSIYHPKSPALEARHLAVHQVDFPQNQ